MMRFLFDFTGSEAAMNNKIIKTGRGFQSFFLYLIKYLISCVYTMYFKQCVALGTSVKI